MDLENHVQYLPSLILFLMTSEFSAERETKYQLARYFQKGNLYTIDLWTRQDNTGC